MQDPTLTPVGRLIAQKRPDLQILEPTVMEPAGAHDPLEREAAFDSHALRRRVVRVDIQLQPVDPLGTE
jgi:hypothetical protein